MGGRGRHLRLGGNKRRGRGWAVNQVVNEEKLYIFSSASLPQQGALSTPRAISSCLPPFPYPPVSPHLARDCLIDDVVLHQEGALAPDEVRTDGAPRGGEAVASQEHSAHDACRGRGGGSRGRRRQRRHQDLGIVPIKTYPFQHKIASSETHTCCCATICRSLGRNPAHLIAPGRSDHVAPWRAVLTTPTCVTASWVHYQPQQRQIPSFLAAAAEARDPPQATR